ncbi:MAG: hypothetical protein AABZ62_01440, partial [Planctomycetota bacterium]
MQRYSVACDLVSHVRDKLARYKFSFNVAWQLAATLGVDKYTVRQDAPYDYRTDGRGFQHVMRGR